MIFIQFKPIPMPPRKSMVKSGIYQKEVQIELHNEGTGSPKIGDTNNSCLQKNWLKYNCKSSYYPDCYIIQCVQKRRS